VRDVNVTVSKVLLCSLRSGTNMTSEVYKLSIDAKYKNNRRRFYVIAKWMEWINN